jgi:hypothetical protein
MDDFVRKTSGRLFDIYQYLCVDHSDASGYGTALAIGV